MSESRTLPHHLDAERAVLGAVMVDQAQLAEATELLRPEMFYRAAHLNIYAAMIEVDRRGDPIDLMLLAEHLRRAGTLEDVGGPAYLAALMDGVPRGVNTGHYAALVRDRWLCRQVIFVANRLMALGYDAVEGGEAIITEAERLLLDLSRGRTSEGYVHAEQFMRETFQTIQRLADGQQYITGLATGFGKLDGMTRGLQPGNLIIVAARPSMGKTSFALQIALEAARHGTVGFVSVEMGRQEIGLRAAALQARINNFSLLTGRLGSGEYERLTPALGEIARGGFAIDDSPIMGPEQLRSRARRLASTHHLVLLVVDYLQLLDGKGLDAENRQQEVAQTSRILKQIAKELQVPLVALAQLSRANEARADKRPQLSDLRESGALEQDADVVLLLHRPEYYEREPTDPGLAELMLAKQRNGPTGLVKLRFISQQTRFESWKDGDS
ncbi:MAG: replicative DNA helicase [Vicinamibacterales bacterium]|nr:replicative DNA helicase [Vicinamibacterales bacterium]